MILSLSNSGSLSPDSRPTTEGIVMSSKSSWPVDSPAVLDLENPGTLLRMSPLCELGPAFAFWSTMLVSVIVDVMLINAVYDAAKDEK
jgi:hypothetical protein